MSEEEYEKIEFAILNALTGLAVEVVAGRDRVGVAPDGRVEDDTHERGDVPAPGRVVPLGRTLDALDEIGRASCRERVSSPV